MKGIYFKYSVFALLIGLLFNLKGFAQDDNDIDNFKFRFKFETVKQIDNSRLLEVSFIGTNKKDRKDKLPVYEAEIVFFNVTDSNKVELGKAKTNNEGIAQLFLPENQEYLTDAEGFINFRAEFKGSDVLGSKKKKISVKNVFMEIELVEIDSLKTVLVHAYSLDSANAKVPVEEADIILSVGGLISRMPFAEETLEEGELEIEFPENIPGDKNGLIEVYASMEDHDDFGNVIQMKTVDWGTFDDIVVVNKQTLWSDIAPIWMYVVLSILLIGVWANFVYTIINLVKISKEGKPEAST